MIKIKLTSMTLYSDKIVWIKHTIIKYMYVNILNSSKAPFLCGTSKYALLEVTLGV